MEERCSQHPCNHTVGLIVKVKKQLATGIINSKRSLNLSNKRL